MRRADGHERVHVAFEVVVGPAIDPVRLLGEGAADEASQTVSDEIDLGRGDPALANGRQGILDDRLPEGGDRCVQCEGQAGVERRSVGILGSGRGPAKVFEAGREPVPTLGCVPEAVDQHDGRAMQLDEARRLQALIVLNPDLRQSADDPRVERRVGHRGRLVDGVGVELAVTPRDRIHLDDAHRVGGPDGEERSIRLPRRQGERRRLRAVGSKLQHQPGHTVGHGPVPKRADGFVVAGDGRQRALGVDLALGAGEDRVVDDEPVLQTGVGPGQALERHLERSALTEAGDDGRVGPGLG